MVSVSDDEFFEEDENLDDVLAAYARGQEHMTEEPRPWSLVVPVATYSPVPIHNFESESVPA